MSVEHDVSEILKDALKKVVVEQTLTRLGAILTFPVVGVILRPVVVFFVTTFVVFMVEKTALGMALLWIMINVGYEVQSVEEITKTLREMLNHPEKYTDEQKAEIEKEFDDRAVKLIRLSIAHL